MSQAFIRFQLRRGFANEWTGTNPVLAAGEVGLETDTGRFKVGDGEASWRQLPYGGEQGEQGPQGEPGLMIGQLALTPSAMSLPGTLPANGMQLTSALHPELAQMLGYDDDLPAEEVMGLPPAAEGGFDINNGTYGCAASPDGLVAISVWRSFNTTVQLFDTSTWEPVFISDLPDFITAGNSVAFSPDGVYLAYSTRTVSSRPRNVFLLDRAADTYITIPDTPSSVSNLAFTSDNSYLAMVFDQRLQLLDLSTMTFKTLPQELDRLTSSIAVSNTGKDIALSHSDEPQVTIFDTDTFSIKQERPVLPAGTGGNIRFAYSSDDAWLAVSTRGDPRVIVFDTQTWLADSPELEIDGIVVALAFSPNNSILLVSHLEPPYLTAFHTSDWSQVTTLPSIPYAPRNEGLAFTPDGRHLVVGRETQAGIGEQGYSIFSTGIADTFTLPDVSSDDPRMVWRIKNQESS